MVGWVQSLEHRVNVYHCQGPSCTHPRAPSCKQSYCGLLTLCQVYPSWISPFMLCLALPSFPFNLFHTFLSQKVFLNQTHQSLSFPQHSPQVFSHPTESFRPPVSSPHWDRGSFMCPIHPIKPGHPQLSSSQMLSHQSSRKVTPSETETPALGGEVSQAIINLP